MRLKQIKRLAIISLIWLGFIISSVEAKTLIYCAEASPAYLSPPYARAANEIDVVTQVFDRLVEFEPDSTKLMPGLAESWDISPDGLTYTFKLRKGISFHNTKDFKPTRNFNADDVIFTFERQLRKDHPYHKISGGNYTFFESLGLNNVLESIEKVDDYTVQFKLKQPEASFLIDLAMINLASIMSAEFADQMMKASTPEKFDQTPIGTGPFIFTDYQKDAAIRFKANPDYWRGKPKIDNLVFSITTDPGIRLAKLEKGECHVMPHPNLADIDKLRKKPNLTVLEQESLNIGFLALNTEKPPLDNVQVRKALAMAIDKQAIINAIFQGHGIAATNPISPTLWSYNKDIRDYPYDPKQAKKLLAEVGYPNGFEIDLWALPVARPYNPNGKRMAELIQADWVKIGVKAKIITYEWGEYVKRGQEGEHQTYLIGWQGLNGDPDNFLHTRFSCDAIKGKFSFTRWCNEKFDNLVLTAKKTSDIDERTKLYEEAQEVFHENLPAIPLTHSKNIRLIRDEVKNYKQNPIGYDYLYYADIDEKPHSSNKAKR